MKIYSLCLLIIHLNVMHVLAAGMATLEANSGTWHLSERRSGHKRLVDKLVVDLWMVASGRWPLELWVWCCAFYRIAHSFKSSARAGVIIICLCLCSLVS